jgi:argininosuccinate lyase
MTLYKGRIPSQASSSLKNFTYSIIFDKRLAPFDIKASIAHVNQLEQIGIITTVERDILAAALNQVLKEIESGEFKFLETDEDIHTAIERRVIEIAGTPGAKLHTGRSRNDQVITALRLFVRAKLIELADKTIHFCEVLLKKAEAYDGYMPGYTHLQQAQPVLVAHYFLAHIYSFFRDLDRISDTLKRVNVSSLGAGAIAGSSLELRPEEIANELGFERAFKNSMDAVSDRDFAAETLFCIALIGIHLSRLGEEVVLFSSQEFGFLTLDDMYSTGSSMLPQKKNPDIAELARGKSGRLIGNLTGLLATLKGLPLSYNRDLQEDKEPLFDSFDTIINALDAMAGLVDTMKFDAAKMQNAADNLASGALDLCEWLVERGYTFREAHELIGSIVKDSIERRVPLSELVNLHPDLGSEALEILAPGQSVARKKSPGSTSRNSVEAQKKDCKESLEQYRSKLKKES